ncbi:putative disease resistance RPP13-like protein 1 [Vitis vinifera]|uniref:Putative disease resistance RPP13-like protein 1 n=1 Tax=Vitis vinifera TaxID=29760 RepID=A0A438GG73_VITVI|nr:putative disease resistance RPP13-like protein 1 [Vitis vinifera]
MTVDLQRTSKFYLVVAQIFICFHLSAVLPFALLRETMEVVGEAILSSALELLFDKLGSSELLKFARQENVIGELDNWRDELLIIDEVLDDAEEKQITRKSVKKWLNDLRHLAYDTEDVLDEFTTELLRRRLMAERPQEATTSKVRSLIPTCFTGFNHVGDVRLNVEMGSKIKEISRRLDNISTRQAKLGLKMDLGVGHGWERFASGRRASTWERPPTTSLMNEAVQGTGKTTLTQLVCKDEGIMKHFDPIAWVCISEESDVVKISEAILRALSHNQSTDLNDFNKVQQTLGEILTRKKFLLVLDDVWNINHNEQWNTLQSPFKYGEKGSKIIITTRDADVARTMRAYDARYTLQPLSDDDCWSLFVKHACETENIHVRQNLVLRGKVTKWCGGLPLAAKVLGGLLRSKLHDHTWEDILRSEIWNLPSEKHDILQVLRLSYYHLPSHLKRCFGYCAMFPKDYEFEKKELILLWMAEGLIHQPKGGFDDLLPKLSYLRVLSLSGYEIIELPYSIGDLKLLRYLNLSYTAIKWLPESVSCLYNLQALILSSCIELSRLPMNIGNLINLRHLNIEGSIQLKEMPPRVVNDGMEQEFWRFKNESNELNVFEILQPPDSLKKLAIACYGGLEFPDWLRVHSFSKMEHLSLKSCKKCEQLPPLGRLHSLKELHIEGMDEIVCIGDEFYGEVENPFPSLESLEFDNMPKWKDWKERESLFPCLGNLTIKKCPELINLPSQPSCLWEGFAQSFTALKTLKINPCDEVAFLGLESLGSLQHLEIRSCDGVVSLEEQKLPCNLQRLEVRGCSNLEKLPNGLGSLTFLTKLIISNCPKLVSFPVAGFPPGLTDLTVRDCKGLESLPDGMMNNSCALQSLWIKGCPSLRRFPQGELPTTLKRLRIIGCKSLESLPEGIIRDPSIGSSNTSGLETLRVKECSSLKSIPSGEFPSTLTRLWIWKCNNLESIPGKMLQNLTSLQLLYIYCQNMKRPLSEWGLHRLTSLTRFVIFGPFPDVSLKSVASMGLRNLISLEILVLSNCPQLGSVVPKEGLPPTLAELRIVGCPILEKSGKKMKDNLAKACLSISVSPFMSQCTHWNAAIELVQLIQGEKEKLPHFHIPSMLMMAHLSMKKLPTELSFHWRKRTEATISHAISISLLAWGAGHWNLTGRCSLHHLQWEQGITTYGVLNSVKVSSFTGVSRSSRFRIPCPPDLQNNTSLEYALKLCSDRISIVPAGKRTDVDKKPSPGHCCSLSVSAWITGLESSRDIPKLHLSERQGRMAGLGFDHL